jgi:hypothetical protein
MLVGPLLVLAALALLLHLTRPGRPVHHRRRRWQNAGVALAWAGAAIVHLTIIGEHFEESLALGWFFALLCLMQFAYAATAWIRATPHLLAVGVAASAAVVTLWTYTRTVNIPFGLGSREPVGVVDLIATGLEIVAIVLSLNVLWTDRAARPLSVAKAGV